MIYQGNLPLLRYKVGIYSVYIWYKCSLVIGYLYVYTSETMCVIAMQKGIVFFEVKDIGVGCWVFGFGW